MTHIVNIDKYPTKKSFKQAIAEGKVVRVIDPAIINPVGGSVDYVLRTLEQRGEDGFVVTNHPKRTWFAHVTRDKRTGNIKVE